MSARGIISLLIIAIIAACKKPYDPPAITSSPGGYLVVEGVINSGVDSTFIKISRTVSISSSVVINPLAGAFVSVLGDQNNTYPLTEIKPGAYACAGLNLDNAHKYRLSILTPDKKQYLSDFMAVVNSPPIDTVSYLVTDTGLNVYVNTHDPKNATHYYRWSYNETWRFHSDFNSHYISNGDTVLTRYLAKDQIYICWRSDTSSTIVLNSSAKLKTDVIFQNPITFVKSISDKLVSEYSVQVTQYALTPEAYAFWQNIKKNTEQLGSIFDAQPSSIKGNIHSVTNPSEPVIGYLSVGSPSIKRGFAFNRNLPAWQPPPKDDGCMLQACFYAYVDPHTKDTVNQVNEYINYNKGARYPLIPVDALVPPGGAILGYSASTPECVDCTLKGTNIQPSYWRYQ